MEDKLMFRDPLPGVCALLCLSFRGSGVCMHTCLEFVSQ